MFGKILFVLCMVLFVVVFWYGKEGIWSGMMMIGDIWEVYFDKVNKGVEGGW